MSGSEVHHYLGMVRHDLETLALLSKGAGAAAPPADVTDWKCTLLFYMACIYVKALGRLRQKDLQDHYEIRQWLNTAPELLQITRPYRKLEERSRDARYEGRRFDRSEMQQALAWFVAVRDRISDLLKAGGIAPLPTIDPAPLL